MPRIPISDIDRQIGRRIRRRRKDWDIPQKALAATLDVSCQQIHKYEAAQDKVAASTLAEIAHQLQVPMAWFFEVGGRGHDAQEKP